jgi:hypothetical protein
MDPFAPQENKLGGPEIAVNHLGKAGGEAAPVPAVSQPHQSAPAFDPISLSQIARRAEPAPAQEPPAQAEGIAKEPQQGFSSGQAGFSVSAAEPPAAAPAFSQAAAPSPSVSRPAQAATAYDKAAADALAQKLDSIARTAATKQDLAAAVDPFRLKLDQISDLVTTLNNSPAQREIMEKLARLENAITDIKATMRQVPASAAAAAQAPANTVTFEKNSDTVFGVQPAEEKPAEKKKEAPAKAQSKPVDIVDTGSKKSNIGPMLRKLVNFVVTMVLLVGIVVAAVIGLKNFGVYDATKFIPSQVPFIGATPQPEQPPVPAAKPAEAAAGQQAKGQPQGSQAAQPGQPQQAKAPDISAEIIYFTRTYTAYQNGPTLEDTLAAQATVAGGEYAKVNWQVKPNGDNVYEVSAMIPSAGGPLTYSFIADYAKKTLLPGNDPAKPILDAMVPKPPAKRKAARGRKKTPARAKAGARKPAAAAGKAASNDEYEYVYEDDDGTGGK